MEPLNAAQARDHVEMVERILVQSSQRLCSGGEYFVVWGLFSACATVLNQVVSNGVLPARALWIDAVLLLFAVTFTVVRGRAKQAEATHLSLVQQEFFRVLWLTLGLALVANLVAFNLFKDWGSAAIWSFAAAVILLFIGLHGNRRAMAGAVVVVLSLAGANFAPATIAGYILAAGMLLGYAGFGLAELVTHE